MDETVSLRVIHDTMTQRDNAMQRYIGRVGDAGKGCRRSDKGKMIATARVHINRANDQQRIIPNFEQCHFQQLLPPIAETIYLHVVVGRVSVAAVTTVTRNELDETREFHFRPHIRAPI